MERIRVTQNIMVDSNLEAEMTNSVFENVKAVAYCHSLGMNDEVIKENIAKIFDFSEDMKNCKNCKGMKYCNKEPKYLVTNITYEDGVVDRNLLPCKKYLEQLNFKKRLVVADFGDEFLDNYIGKDVSNINSKSKKDVLRKYQESAVLKKSNDWIYIKGDISTGKSFFAATLCVDAARNKLFNSVSFVDVPERFKQLTDLAFQKSPKFVELLDRIKNSEMLVLDDLGNEFRSDFVRDNIFFPILSYRAKNKLFTLITSNYSIDDICTMYSTNNSSKPKIEQIRQMLKMMCKEEITLPSILAQ